MAVMFLCFYLVFVDKSFISPDKTDTLLDLLPTNGYDVNTSSTFSCTFSSPVLIKRSPVIFVTGSALHDIPPNVLTMLTGPPFHALSSSRRSRVTLLLLILAGVESNPGPRHSFRLDVFNAEGASRKAAGLSDIITDNRLDAVAVCETWMWVDARIQSSLGLLPLASPFRTSTDRSILADLPAVMDSPSSPLTTLWSDHIRCKIQLHRQRLSNGSCSTLGLGTRSSSSRTSIEGCRRRKQPSSTSSPIFCLPSVCKLETAF